MKGNTSISNYRVCDDSFGYLMYLLYKNNSFSELHLPSLNRIKINNKNLIMIKQISREFKQRIEEIKQVIKKSRKTNMFIQKEEIRGGDIFLTLNSQLGESCESKELSKAEKKKIINLFFEYHKQINNPKIDINTSYHSFFNKRKLKKDILKLKKRINSKKKSDFDKNVLNYLKLISKQKIDLSYGSFKMCNVHGDFSLRNIVKIKKGYFLIDLDMLHQGYLEIQFIRLLKDLFGFATKSFFENLKDYYKNLPTPKRDLRELFKLYLFHKIFDLSTIKSAYFTDEIKYLELQNHINSQIDFISNLINKEEEFSKIFSLNIEQNKDIY